MTAKAKSFLKYALAFILLGFVLRSAGIEQITGYLKQISLPYFLLALLLVSFAQLASALRMRFFFRANGFPLNVRYALILAYVGAFYNFLLPGGIGGDAYKVILARRRMDMPAKQGIRIMIADRASGLCILMLVLSFMLYHIHLIHEIPYIGALAVSAGLITLVCYIAFCRWLLKQSPLTMLASLPYSFAVQLLSITTLITLWRSFGNGQHIAEYITFYAAASITGLLPVSVGGLGIKEMTYYYGASFMQHFAGVQVDPQLGIALSLCLFAIAFLASLPGLLWLEKVEKTSHL